MARNYDYNANDDDGSCQYVPTLTTNPVTVIGTTIESGGYISYDGGSAITQRGVCWSTTPNPVISNDTTINGNGIGSFTSIINNLQLETTYYLRAYATNSNGTGYGNVLSFTNALPVLTTNPVTVIGTTIESGGYISYDGGSAITQRGVCWSTTPNPVISNDTTINGNGIGIFTSIINNLQVDTTYYLRAYATNSYGTGYGNERSFTTTPSIGDTYKGGIVFYLNPNGGGLIAAPSDYPYLAMWGCYGTAIYPYNGGATGYQATLNIVAGCNIPDIAADVCANMTHGGYTDWYLPSEDELQKLFEQKFVVGCSSNSTYWSSGESGNDPAHYARKRSFNSLAAAYGAKYDLLQVRAIRAF